MDRLRSALDEALGPSKVITSDEGCLRYAGDESDQEPVRPDAVVLASSPADIERCLAPCIFEPCKLRWEVQPPDESCGLRTPVEPARRAEPGFF